MSSIDDGEDDYAFEQTSIIETHRLIDWVKVCTTPVLIGFNVFIIAIALDAMSSKTQASSIQLSGIIALAAPILFFTSLISQLMGTYFNVTKDRLSYPYYAWRLRLRLSGIHDANAQNINKRGFDLVRSIGEKNAKFKTIHHYHVNLSGDFGARRLMFRSKYKRDQFLSILQDVRPDVRITRWS
jgi:hypothetical protein